MYSIFKRIYGNLLTISKIKYTKRHILEESFFLKESHIKYCMRTKENMQQTYDFMKAIAFSGIQILISGCVCNMHTYIQRDGCKLQALKLYNVDVGSNSNLPSVSI